MSFPKITINNFKDGSNNNNKLVLKFVNLNNKDKSKKLRDNSISTNTFNYNNYHESQTLPIKINNYQIILPIVDNRLNNSNIKKVNKNINIISKSVNHKIKKKFKKRIKDDYYYYHPWINNSYNNNEINAFMSNCYDITKIDTYVNENQYKINDSKLTNKLLREVEKRYKIANIFQKKKLNTIKFDNLIKNKNIFIETKNIKVYNSKKNNKKLFFNKYNHLRNFKPINTENKIHSLENSYSSLIKKNIKTNETQLLKDYHFKDFISLKKKEKPSSSLNTSYSKKDKIIEELEEKILSHRNDDNDHDNKDSLIRDYKTIKIKKIINNNINNNYNGEKIKRNYKIKSNFLYKKNITFSSLLSETGTQTKINNSNLINKIAEHWNHDS